MVVMITRTRQEAVPLEIPGLTGAEADAADHLRWELSKTVVGRSAVNTFVWCCPGPADRVGREDQAAALRR
jgi:hypothetical protein